MTVLLVIILTFGDLPPWVLRLLGYTVLAGFISVMIKFAEIRIRRIVKEAQKGVQKEA